MDDVKIPMVNKSTSTSDLKENTLSKSASTDNLLIEDLLPGKTSQQTESEIEILNSEKVDTRQVCDDPKPLTKSGGKAKSTPNILEGMGFIY